MLTIENAGSLAADYRLTARIEGDRQFGAHLWVVASRRQDGATVFSGPVSALTSVALGRFAAATRQTLRLSVTLRPARSGGDDNALQGRRASVDFSWTATQA